LLDLLQGCKVRAHLRLLGGELVLIGGDLPYASPYDCEIDCDQLYLLRQLRAVRSPDRSGAQIRAAPK
jgi:hypothetical protein